MQAGNIMEVELSRIVPGDNPRKDFGDIDALAAAIEATGGRPVNPIVVVLDGGSYRLVDGERRWRALRRLHGEGGVTEALVYPSYDAAEEAVAMVATDSKKELSEQEAARGFQRMLMLDVPVERVAKALRRPTADIEKARMVAESAGEQTTLDQMIAAAEFEGEDRLAVLAEDTGWEYKARSIRNRIAAERRDAELRALFEANGIRVADKAPRNMAGRSFYEPDTFEEVLAEILVSWRGDELVACKNNWGSWEVFNPAPAKPEPTEEELAAAELIKRRDAAVAALTRQLLGYVFDNPPVFPSMSTAVGRLRYELMGYNWQVREKYDKLVKQADEVVAGRIMYSVASVYEIAAWLLSPSGNWWQWVSVLLPAAESDQYEMTEEDVWLLEQARDARSEYERKQAERAAAEAGEGDE